MVLSPVNFTGKISKTQGELELIRTRLDAEIVVEQVLPTQLLTHLNSQSCAARDLLVHQARLEVAKAEFTVSEKYAASASQRVIITETSARNRLDAWQHRAHAQMLLANGQIEGTRIALQDAAELEASSKKIINDSVEKADSMYNAAEALEKHVPELVEPIARLTKHSEITSLKVRAIRPDIRSHREKWEERHDKEKMDGKSYRQRLRDQQTKVDNAAALKPIQEALAEEARIEAAITNEVLEIGQKKAEVLQQQVDH